MKKILILIVSFFAVFVCITIGFSRDFLYIFYESFIDTSHVTDSTAVLYNRALSLARDGEYDRARASIDQIRSEENYREKISELRGDIAWQADQDLTGALIAYESARDASHGSLPRIEYKIAFLESFRYREYSQQENPDTDMTKTPNADEQSVIDDQKKRSEYMNPLPTDAAYEREEYDRLKSLIERGEYSEEQDW